MSVVAIHQTSKPHELAREINKLTAGIERDSKLAGQYLATLKAGKPPGITWEHYLRDCGVKVSARHWSKKQYRELMALIAAEQRAKTKAQKMPRGAAPVLQTTLFEAVSAASELRGILTDPLGFEGDFPSERIELLTGALDFAVAASEASRGLIWATRAIEIAEQLAAQLAREDEDDIEQLLEQGWL